MWPFCGILVPRPGIEPGPLAVRVLSPNHWAAREFPLYSHFMEFPGGQKYKYVLS